MENKGQELFGKEWHQMMLDKPKEELVELLKKEWQKSESYILNQVNEMCIQSLSPEKFEMWEQVKTWLDINRNINPIKF